LDISGSGIKREETAPGNREFRSSTILFASCVNHHALGCVLNASFRKRKTRTGEPSGSSEDHLECQRLPGGNLLAGDFVDRIMDLLLKYFAVRRVDLVSDLHLHRRQPVFQFQAERFFISR
jgi:hypothetical protein